MRKSAEEAAEEYYWHEGFEVRNPAERVTKAFIAGFEYDAQDKWKAEPEFIEFVKNERKSFSYKAAHFFFNLSADDRVVIENLLIAYDQMVEKLKPNQ